ncbi:hypothetical protein LVB77_05480 [Lysobacter sp. 5GHs7-4]|uniref:hypothetical protein n=1 Tax=Lysobacter sp. 5GHs7-4 TaxID=2904253 RepID=UPI001E3B2653|nr:hypothetical protein [Lysobacter sp. 5GHs7-4]UHQ24155.1 hypothetical protein LVB77_05480 [Lysobacter sp. 5GHs7-4]
MPHPFPLRRAALALTGALALAGCSSFDGLSSPLTCSRNEIRELGDATPAQRRYAFPFRIEYEQDGRRAVVENSLICAYRGRDYLGDCESSNRWSASLAHGRGLQVPLGAMRRDRQVAFDPGDCELLVNHGQDQPAYLVIGPDAGEADDAAVLDPLSMRRDYGIRIVDYRIDLSARRPQAAR